MVALFHDDPDSTPSDQLRSDNSDAPSYEVYFNTPMTVPKSELRTEIRIPVLA